MVKLFIAIAKTARPRQWIKNLAIFAALVFTGSFFDPNLFSKTVLGFIALSILVSSVYFINDVSDVNVDKLHPFKKNRPIAKGDLPITTALILAFLGILTAFGIANFLSQFFFLSLAAYLILQLTYTFWLKEVVVVDILAIATGFVIRVYAGAFLIDAHLSIWFLLCVISVSLFLAAGKRRAELAILTEKGAAAHRKVMGKYTTDILDRYVGMFAKSSYLSWALYTFNFYEQAPSLVPSSLILLSRTLTINKWLMATIPVVIFGIMRYIRIIYDGARAETPEKVILSDLPLLLAVAMWGAFVVAVLYLGPS